MTTESQASGPSTSLSRRSIHVLRARKLLYGGLVGGGAASAVCILGFTAGYGTRGLVSAAFAAALVLVFYVIGQVVMVLFADAGARTLLLVSLGSYTMRVLMLGLVLLSYNSNRADWPQLVPMAVFVTTIAVVVGWLAVEVFVFSRLRIGVYDTEYVAPRGGIDAQ
jgi:hypothetical protein